MELKKYLNNYEKKVTRKELIKFGLICSIPFIFPIALIIILISRPHDKKGKWIEKG